MLIQFDIRRTAGLACCSPPLANSSYVGPVLRKLRQPIPSAVITARRSVGEGGDDAVAVALAFEPYVIAHGLDP